MEKVEKVVKNNFFHDLGLQNGLSRGKNCQKQLFPRFGPPKRLESWKKLFLTTFSTNFMILKTSSTIRGKSGKGCQKQLFPRFGPPKRLESWKKLFLTTFPTIFMIPKTSSTIRGKSGKSCQNQLFPRLKLFWRPKSWKKLVLTTFSTISMIPKDFLKVGLANIFRDSGRFGGPNRGKSWPGQLSRRFTNTFHA